MSEILEWEYAQYSGWNHAYYNTVPGNPDLSRSQVRDDLSPGAFSLSSLAESFVTADTGRHGGGPDAPEVYSLPPLSNHVEEEPGSAPLVPCCELEGDLGLDPGRVRVTSGRPSALERLGFRFRRRGRLTNGISKAFCQILRKSIGEVGGQTSLLGATLWIKTIQLAGIKVVDSHPVQVGEDTRDWWLTLTQDDRSTVVSLEVYTKLALYVTFRARSSDLVLSLRTRAVQKAKEMGYSGPSAAFVVPGSVALAMLALPNELSAYEFMGGSGGETAEHYSSALRSGEIESSYDSVNLPLLAAKHSWGDWFKSLASGGYNTRQGRRLVPERA